MQLAQNYPSGAIGHACALCRADVGEIVERRPTGDVRRPSRVVITNIDIDFEGALCICEKCARHMAHLFGMVDDWRVQQMMVEQTRVLTDLGATSAEVVTLRSQVEVLQAMATEPSKTEYVALDGSRHASAVAAEDASLRSMEKAPLGFAGVHPITETEAPAQEILEAVRA